MLLFIFHFIPVIGYCNNTEYSFWLNVAGINQAIPSRTVEVFVEFDSYSLRVGLVGELPSLVVSHQCDVAVKHVSVSDNGTKWMYCPPGEQESAYKIGFSIQFGKFCIQIHKNG